MTCSLCGGQYGIKGCCCEAKKNGIMLEGRVTTGTINHRFRLSLSVLDAITDTYGEEVSGAAASAYITAKRVLSSKGKRVDFVIGKHTFVVVNH